jgi:Skp family chaperone for outer membrane proteins
MSVVGVNEPEVAATPAAPEVAAPEVAVAPKVDPLAPKFAALSRKEKEVRSQAQQIAQQKAEYEKQLAEFTKQRTEWEENQKKSSSDYKQRLKENPINELMDAGYTPQQIAEILMNEGNPTPEMKLNRVKQELESGYKAELAELRKMLEEKEASSVKQQEEQLKAQQEQAVKAFKSEVGEFLTKNSEKYELSALNPEQSIETIYDTIDLYYQETSKEGKPKILTIDEAAELVENYLSEEANKIYEVKRKRESAKPEAKVKTETAPTLSNTAASEVPTNGERRLSREDEIREVAKWAVRISE